LEPSVDVTSYFAPDDIAALATFEAGHYWHLARRKVVLEALPRVEPGARMIDIGCGPGTTTTFLNRHRPPIDYADVHGEAATLARSLAIQELGADASSKLRFLTFDIAVEPMPDGYHGALLLDVIEHLPDDVGALRNVRTGLQRGDGLLVTVPAFPQLWSRFDEIARHKRRYTKATLGRAMQAGGFEIERMTYFFAPLFLASGAVQLARHTRDMLPARFRSGDADLSELAEARTSPALTRALVAVLGAERHLMRHRDVPFGTSVLCRARAR
jgi:SAM-dependent methyltransferase